MVSASVKDDCCPGQPKDGGAAFPRVGAYPGNVGKEDGMSLRDWFAGMALQGLLACPRDISLTPKGEVREHSRHKEVRTEHIDAEWAYRYADAMLNRKHIIEHGKARK